MLPEPHGGRLVDRLLSPGDRARREGEIKDIPSIQPHIDQLYDVEKIGIGAYSPLEGFMDSEGLASVLGSGRLPGGDLPWSIPIYLPVPPETDAALLAALKPGDDVALRDGSGRAIAILHLKEKFHLDRSAIAAGAYGTTDPAHPNVADILAQGDTALAGPVDLIQRLELPGGRQEPTPTETREEFHRRGWKNVAAYQCRNPPHTAHEYLQRLTLERDDVDGLFVHPVVGRLKKGDYRPEVILRAYEALLTNYYPANRVMLAPLSITMRYGGPKAALFLAIVRKNYGCGLYIVGRDQAGVGKFYAPMACQEIFGRFDLGIKPLLFGEAFFCRRCGWMASDKTCVHPASDRVDTSQSRVRNALANGTPLPAEILRPEISEILRAPDVILT